MTQPRKEQINLLRSYWTKFTYTATAGTTSTTLSGLAASSVTGTSGGDATSNPPIRGIITSGSGGLCRIRKQSNGQSLDDAAGAQIFGRLTESSGTYTISYKIISGGSEVAGTLPGAGSFSVEMIFPEVMKIGEVPASATTIFGDNIDLNPVSGGSGTFTDLTVTGNTALGDNSADTITTTARLASDFIPSADNTRVLGSSSRRWGNIHSSTFSAKDDATDTIKTTFTASGLESEGVPFDVDGDQALFFGVSTATAIGIGRTGITVTLAGSLVVSAGSTLSTTGTGNINLPNNASSRFQIESISVGSTVTAANLITLTNSSNADSLHTHAGLANLIKTAGDVVDDGELVCIDGYSGVPRVLRADADAMIDGYERRNAIGVSDGYAAPGDPITVVLFGEKEIPDSEWDSVPTDSDVGKEVYLSEIPGNWTLTAPVTLGARVQRCGIVSIGGAGAVKVIIQIGDGHINS